MKYEIKKIIVKPVNRIVLFITTMIVIVFALLAVMMFLILKMTEPLYMDILLLKSLQKKRTNGREI